MVENGGSLGGGEWRRVGGLEVGMAASFNQEGKWIERERNGFMV